MVTARLAFHKAFHPLAAIAILVERISVCSNEQNHRTGDSGLKNIQPLLESILPSMLRVREHINNQEEKSARGEEHLGGRWGRWSTVSRLSLVSCAS